MKLHRIRPKHLIEALLVVVVLAILLAVSIPSFFKAQHLSSVAKAMHDLKVISERMAAYNLDNPGLRYEMHHTVINGRGDNGADIHVSRLQEARSGNLDPWSFMFRSDDTLSTYEHHVSLLADLPAPPRAMLLRNGYEFINRYTVASGTWRQLERFRRFDINAPVNYDQTLPFDAQARLPFVGVMRGPYYDRHIGEQEFGQLPVYIDLSGYPYETTASWLMSDTHHVEYSPTNGVRSHGYVVYRSSAESVKSVTDYYPDFRVWPVEETPVVTPPPGLLPKP